MTRRTSLRLALPIVLATQLMACGGLSEEDAREQCDAEREARDVSMGGCMDVNSYQQCIDAYEECGVDTEASSACPPVFTCPD